MEWDRQGYRPDMGSPRAAAPLNHCPSGRVLLDGVSSGEAWLPPGLVYLSSLPLRNRFYYFYDFGLFFHIPSLKI